MKYGSCMVVIGTDEKYRENMSAEKLNVDERILITRQKYFFREKK